MLTTMSRSRQREESSALPLPYATILPSIQPSACWFDYMTRLYIWHLPPLAGQAYNIKGVGCEECTYSTLVGARSADACRQYEAGRRLMFTGNNDRQVLFLWERSSCQRLLTSCKQALAGLLTCLGCMLTVTSRLDQVWIWQVFANNWRDRQDWIKCGSGKCSPTIGIDLCAITR